MLRLLVLVNVLILTTVGLAAFTDLRHGTIPNWLTLPAMALGIFLGIAAKFLVIDRLAGLFLGLAFLWPWYRAGGFGGGDVKLMGAVGSLGGTRLLLQSAVCTALVGGIWSALRLLGWYRRRGQPDSSHTPAAALTIPYGAVIALGTTMAVLYSLKGRGV